MRALQAEQSYVCFMDCCEKYVHWGFVHVRGSIYIYTCVRTCTKSQRAGIFAFTVLSIEAVSRFVLYPCDQIGAQVGLRRIITRWLCMPRG